MFKATLFSVVESWNDPHVCKQENGLINCGTFLYRRLGGNNKRTNQWHKNDSHWRGEQGRQTKRVNTKWCYWYSKRTGN